MSFLKWQSPSTHFTGKCLVNNSRWFMEQYSRIACAHDLIFSSHSFQTDSQTNHWPKRCYSTQPTTFAHENPWFAFLFHLSYWFLAKSDCDFLKCFCLFFHRQLHDRRIINPKQAKGLLTDTAYESISFWEVRSSMTMRNTHRIWKFRFTSDPTAVEFCLHIYSLKGCLQNLLLQSADLLRWLHV